MAHKLSSLTVLMVSDLAKSQQFIERYLGFTSMNGGQSEAGLKG